MLDYTKMVKKLNPDSDGEPPAHMRTGTVDAVNSDGTVDIEMSSGVLVPDVPRLESANVAVGSIVQMISFRGSLLVIGPVGTEIPTDHIVAYNSADTDSVAGSSGSEVVILTVTAANLISGRSYRVWAEFHATPGSAGVAGAVRIREGGNLSGTELRVAYADFPNAGTAGNHFLLSAKYTAGSTGSHQFTATAQATGATMRREAASTRVTEMWVETADE